MRGEFLRVGYALTRGVASLNPSLQAGMAPPSGGACSFSTQTQLRQTARRWEAPSYGAFSHARRRADACSLNAATRVRTEVGRVWREVISPPPKLSPPNRLTLGGGVRHCVCETLADGRAVATPILRPGLSATSKVGDFSSAITRRTRCSRRAWAAAPCGIAGCRGPSTTARHRAFRQCR